jgi:hypothetical protein
MVDAIVAVLAVAAFMWAFGSAGLRWWVWFWAGMTGLLALFELASKLETGRTLSQQFWAYSLNHHAGAWMLAGLVAAGGIGLAAHLLWKIIR